MNELESFSSDRIYHAVDLAEKDKEIAGLKSIVKEAAFVAKQTHEYELRRQKYKRCLKMAEWCNACLYQFPAFGTPSNKESGGINGTTNGLILPINSSPISLPCQRVSCHEVEATCTCDG